MLTKEKRHKLISGILTISMAASFTAGCSGDAEKEQEEWNNDNKTAQQKSSDGGFWSMLTAFGLGYALSNMFNSRPTPLPPPPPAPAQTSSPSYGKNTDITADDKVKNSTQNKTVTKPKIYNSGETKSGIGTGANRSHAVS